MNEVKANTTKVKKNPKGVKVNSFEVTHKGKKYEFSINEPDFEVLAYALSKLTRTDGTLDFAHAGKAIWDSCVVEYDRKIEQTPALLLKVCMQLATLYLEDLEGEIKKK